MRKRQKKSQFIFGIMTAMFGMGFLMSMVGLSRAISDIDGAVISKEPEVILANAGLDNGEKISLPVTYFDQKQDKCVNIYDNSTRKELLARQFEWSECGYNNQQIEQGLVDYNLGEDYLPIAMGGTMLSNRGLKNMERWFKVVDGESKEYAGQLQVNYKTNNEIEFSFLNNDFYPLDEVNFSAGDTVNKDGHNHLFTMSYAMPFTVAANGSELFEIVADDDTFVFLGDKLILDMGGIHEAVSGKFLINEAGEISTAVGNEELAYAGEKAKKGEESIIRIFHADRDAGNGSVLNMNVKGMVLSVMQTQLADNVNGVQVAYDPSDPSYVGPLGESAVVRPDDTKGRMIVVSIIGVMVVIFAIFMAISAGMFIKSRLNIKSSK